MPKTSATINDLLELAIALENATDAFYRGLAVLFAHEVEVERFWRHYADAEAGHARWIENLRAQMDESKLRQPTDPGMLETARTLLKTSPESQLEKITNLEEAYRAAIEIENSETNSIFELLITDFALTSRSGEFLRTQLHSHVSELTKAFPSPFQSSLKRSNVKAKR
jgi:rubrerythrin